MEFKPSATCFVPSLNMFFEPQLYARPCVRLWGNAGNETDKVLSLWNLNSGGTKCGRTKERAWKV